ncbi:ZPR1 zinc finger domain-containing protein [Methanocella sp. MCL-LM]|uniref:ZPR1 zinc finger domain-containing protein n=1 Tax=Methanocella sp. MCL-LM TaxID=3412035 RepID=UPI003C7690C8
MSEIREENLDEIATATAKVSCPVCHSDLEMRSHQDNIPYFGDVLEISSVCTCGFKYADTLILSQRDPLRHTMKVCSEGHMCNRVIRSTSGTMRIPEWGIDIEPGPASEAYISNVEGVLDRIETVVSMARKWAEAEEEVEKADQLLKIIDDARTGNVQFTLIIEDPLGNSAIIGDEVSVEPLSPEYAENLHTGMFVVQK